MTDISTSNLIGIATLAVVGALLAWGAWAAWRRFYGSTWMVLRRIGRERLTDVVIPDGVDGEIHLEHLVLTDRGILVLELRNAAGALFAGERLDEWRVIDGARRFTFRNPLPPLEARVRSVALLADGAPVVGRVAIIGQVSFAGGRPDRVTTLSELADEFTTPMGADEAGSDEGQRERSGKQGLAQGWQRIVAAARPGAH